MSLIHIARQGQSLGSFSEEEVSEGIASKRFSKEDDLAWTSGMTEWRPLSEVITAWSSESLVGADVTPAALAEPAWERRSELGFFKALFQTIFEVLFSPSKTFSKMKTTGGLGTPLLFYVITRILLIPLLCLHQNHLIKDFIMPWFTAHVREPKIAAMLHDMALGISLQKMMMLGLKMIFGLFITALLLHLSLKILKSSRGRFEATFRMFCYFDGAYALISALFCLINLAVGSLGSISLGIKIFYIIEILIGSSIMGILFFIGLKQVHHLSSGRTIVVLLFAMLVLPLLIALAVGAILVAIALVAKHFLH